MNLTIIRVLLASLLLASAQGQTNDAKHTQIANHDAKCDFIVRICKRSWKHLWRRHCENKCAYEVQVLLAK